ncbi:MAG: J domain-containing protein [Candidatus Eremiobacterota bacterium]
MKFKDYYKILSVDKKSDIKTIKNAYRKLARKYHPDVNPNDPHAEERFKEINEAYEVLSDPEKRKKYDLLGNNWNKVYTGPGGFSGTGFPGFENINFDFQDLGDLGGFSDFFKTFFGGQRGAAPGASAWQRNTVPPKRGRDLTYPIEITLEEAYKGVERSLQVQIQDICPHCRGEGLSGRHSCSNCQGSGRIYKQRKISVKIPPGVKDSSKVRMAGQGETGTGGGSPGDLYLEIKLAIHKFFEVKGDDLYCEIPISVTEAILGAEIQVPTINGSSVLMKIPPETQNGRNFRLSGLGMHPLKGGLPGHQYVKVKVVLPQNLSKREKEIFQELATLRQDNPRAFL